MFKFYRHFETGNLGAETESNDAAAVTYDVFQFHHQNLGGTTSIKQRSLDTKQKISLMRGEKL